MTGKEIVYMGGHWASNVGNAYYNLGAMYLLRNQISLRSSFIGDHPSIWDPRITTSFSLEDQLEMDLLLSGGPILGPRYLPPLMPIWKEIQKRGAKIGFITAGLQDYSMQGITQTLSLLDDVAPDFIITRDSRTFNALSHGSNLNVWQGACYSIFIPQAIGHLPQLREKAGQYALFNFSPGMEPEYLEEFVRNRDNGFGTPTSPVERIIRSRTQVFPGGEGFLEALRAKLGLSKYQNTFRHYDFYSDSPAGNLALIANASVVFTDRVHTCAAALSLGVKTQFVAVDRRSGDGRMTLLRDLVGDEIFAKPCQLDPHDLKTRQTAQAQLLSRVISESFSNS